MTTVPMPLWYEDMESGLKSELGRYRFTRENIVAFARRYDPQPFHLDEEAGRRSHFGGLCASGWHTAAACMRCWADHNLARRAEAEWRGESLPEAGPSPGYQNLKWLKPVYPGDTLTYYWSVVSKRVLNSRPQWGLVFTHTEGINQAGEAVFSFDGKFLAQRREMERA